MLFGLAAAGRRAAPCTRCATRRQRQHPVLAVERLDGGLLVHAEHGGVRRWGLQIMTRQTDLARRRAGGGGPSAIGHRRRQWLAWRQCAPSSGPVLRVL